MHVRDKGSRNVVWLPNGPDLKEFKNFPLPPEETNFSSKRPFLIIYAGAHGEANALENVIEAARLLKNIPIKFIFIGDGPKKDELIKQSSDLQNIEFKDPLSKKNMPLILKNSDAILVSLKDIPIFRYGVSPNKLYDAYAIGRPVITTVSGYIQEEVEKNNLGFTSSGDDPKKLANAINKLFLSSREERERMAIRGRKLAERIYNRDSINNKLDNFLRKKITSH